MSQLAKVSDHNGIRVTFMTVAHDAGEPHYYSATPCGSCGGHFRTFVYNKIYQCPCSIRTDKGIGLHGQKPSGCP